MRLADKSPKSEEFEVDDIVIKSIVLMTALDEFSPPENNPRVDDEQDANEDLAEVRSPKSCAFPADEIFTNSIMFRLVGVLPPPKIPRPPVLFLSAVVPFGSVNQFCELYPTPPWNVGPVVGSTTVTPGLTRNVDPVDGPTFQGGVGFVSQNWLTLPKGTTTERMPVLGGVNATSARGVFGGGYSTSDIEYIQISTLGNSSEFGDRAHADFARPASLSSSTRGLFAGGFKPSSYTNAIDYITITSTGNGKDFGDMSIAVWSRAGCSNSIRGILAGGFASSNFNVIEHLTIATTGNTQDFGDLTRSRREKGGSSSTTRGIFMGGRSPVPSGVNNDEDIIDYITIASTGNAVDFGNLAADRSAGASCSNATRSLFSGGNSSNAIEFVTIATLGNAVDFGDMSNALNRLGSCASSTRGIIAGGSPTNNTIEYVTIATAGDAQDFGDLNAGAKRDIAGLSNGHGGLG